jgi:hypothetical protein
MSLEIVEGQGLAAADVKIVSRMARVDASRSATALRTGFARSGARRVITGAVIVD